ARDDRLAREPAGLAARGLPFARRQDALDFTDEVDAGLLAEAQAAHPVGEAVDAHVEREAVEIGVRRLLDRADHVHRAIAATLVVAIAARLAGDAELTRRQHGIGRPADAHGQATQREEWLHGGT